MSSPTRSGSAGAAVAAAVAVGMGVAVACRTMPVRPAAAPARSFSVESRVAEPRLRVGILVDVPRASVTADSGVVGWVRSPGVAALRPLEAPTLDFASAATPSRVRIAQTGEDVDSVVLEPRVAADTLRIDGVPYRGLLDVRRGDEALTIVNVLNLEDYLKGVVPNELSPQAFPQIEALKAQAVAARTYALRNHGQFQAKGYDLCATAACQVYRGKSTENPLSDRAIDETHGQAATYEGGPIEALYTSTCGGHTEDGENIFDGPSAPYLHGVVCAPEKSAWSLVRTTAPRRAAGEDEGVGRDVALLVALGVLDGRSYPPAYLKAAATEADLKSWTARLVAASKRRATEVEFQPPLSRRGAFFRYLVGSMGWDERARRLLAPGDAEYLLQLEDRGDLKDATESMAAALLIQEGILSPFSDNTLGSGKAISRGQAFGLIARMAEKAGAPGLVSGEFQGSESGVAKATVGGIVAAFTLDPEMPLFKSLDGVHAAASELSLAAGDPIDFVARDGRISFFEVDQSRMGSSADRMSRYFRWEVRLTPVEVARAVARYGRVGEVLDVVPRRIGSSGRVVDLTVVGTEGEVSLKGLKIRGALGLRENLFVVDRQVGPRGEVETFVFTGKGWGHGVGLCQVGAFGMARSGSTYASILTHYYSGVSIEKLY